MDSSKYSWAIVYSTSLIAYFCNKQHTKSKRPSYNELQTCSMIHEMKIPAKQRS